MSPRLTPVRSLCRCRLQTLILSKLRLRRLPNGTSQCEISLLIVLGVDLQCCPAAVVDNLMNRVHDAFDVVLLADDDRGQRSSFLTQRCSGDLILARTLDRRNVKAKRVACLKSTRCMDAGIAVEAIHACASILSEFVLVIFVLT